MTEKLCERREDSVGVVSLVNSGRTASPGDQVPYAISVTLVAISASSGSLPDPSSFPQLVAGNETKLPAKYLCWGADDLKETCRTIHKQYMGAPPTDIYTHTNTHTHTHTISYNYVYYKTVTSRGRSSVVDGLGVRILIGASDFSLPQKVQPGSGAHAASYSNGYRGSFPGVKRPGILTTQFYLMPGLIMSGAIPLLPLHAFVTWTGKNLNLTFA